MSWVTWVTWVFVGVAVVVVVVAWALTTGRLHGSMEAPYEPAPPPDEESPPAPAAPDRAGRDGEG
jgi:NADH:ubiquinone oxidoreductase subunit 3 (subunit A)